MAESSAEVQVVDESNRYQKVLLKKESLRYHLDSEKEASLKSEIKEDIRKMVDLRGKGF